MMNTMMMSRIMAEDSGAPELRNPDNSGRSSMKRWFQKLLGKR